MPSGFDPGAAGISTGGNTAGTSGSQILGTLVLAGGANITLSQSTSAGRVTVSISGGAGGAGYTAGVSTGGNTVGDTGVVTGRLVLAGGDNITLSGSTNAGSMTVTISGASGGGAGYTAGVSTGGNTSGDTGVVTGRLVLAGGNNVTLSGSTNAGSMTVTISAANETQTVPPIATAVKAAVSTVASTGTITRFAPEDHQHQGINSAGISNIGNTSGTSGAGPGRLVLAGGDNVTLSQNTDATGSTVTISAASGGGAGYTAGVSTGGNTSGDTGVVTGRLVLAGGDNVTLSGSTNAGSMTVTISAASGGGAGYTAGVSTGGNTSGDTAVVTGRLVLAGGNNITLSGSSNAGSLTITISAANETQTVPPIATAVKVAVSTVASTGTVTRFAPEDHLHQGINSAGISNIGNTSGTSSVGPGRLVFAGGNQITLSQATDATGSTITISAAETQTVPPIGTAVKTVSTVGSTGTITRFAPEDHMHVGVNSVGISNIGNTSGTSSVGPGRLVLAGGNQVTLSQNTDATGSTVTISIAETQTVPPIATAVKVAVSTTASTGTITRFAPEDHLHQGVNSLGISNLGNTSGTSSVGPGRYVLVGTNLITLSQATDATGSTLTISGPRILTISRYDNAGLHESSTPFASLGTAQSQLQIFPLTPPNDVFPGNMTVSTVLLNMAGGGSSDTSGSYAYSFSFGIYTLNSTNVSVLSLLNSGSVSISKSDASSNNSTAWDGPRWLSMNSSLWSDSISFSQTSYWMGIIVSSAGTRYNVSMQGYFLGNWSTARSGTLGASGASNASVGHYPWVGYVATAGLPVSINISALTHTGASGAFVPNVVFENLLSKY